MSAVEKRKRILILGAGFGGLTVASLLRKGLSLPEQHQIMVIDKKDYFMMGLVNLWILNGTRRLDLYKKVEILTQIVNLLPYFSEYIIETKEVMIRDKAHTGEQSQTSKIQTEHCLEVRIPH
jgi:monoamine oxidase